MRREQTGPLGVGIKSDIAAQYALKIPRVGKRAPICHSDKTKCKKSLLKDKRRGVSNMGIDGARVYQSGGK